MAELVDAPDSKSGHFGGVGSIPSTPTINNTFFLSVQIDLWPEKLNYLFKFLRTKIDGLMNSCIEDFFH